MAIHDTQTTAERASILARRLTLALVALVVGLTLVLILFEYVRGRHQLLRAAQTELNVRVRLVADRLDAALRERQRNAELWPQLEAAQDLAVDDVDQRLTQSLSLLAGSLGGGTVALGTDNSGRVIAASDQRFIGRPAPQPDRAVLVHATRVLARVDGRPLGHIIMLTPWRALVDAAAGPYAGAIFVRNGGRAVYGSPPPTDAVIARARIAPRSDLDLALIMAQPRAVALAPIWRTQRQLLLFALLLVLVAGPAILAIARANAVVLAQQERLAAVGVMAASLAHEIRTPLAILRTSADVLTRSPEYSARDQEVITFILEETQRLESLVNDLLTFARPRAPVLQPTDLAGIARRAASALTAQADQKQVRIKQTLTSANVLADADQLYQVALNLGTNALQASSAGSEIEFATGANGARAIMQVIDHGSGMDAATAERMWAPFFSQRPGGTGLGLAIVKRIVDDHGGHIAVNTAPGAGTRVSVQLATKGNRA